MEASKLEVKPRLQTATVTLTITAPEDCSEYQFITWIMQEIGAVPTDPKHRLFVHDLRGNVSDVRIKIVKPKTN